MDSSSVTDHETSMDSSKHSAESNSSQPQAADAAASCVSLLDHRLLTPLLRHSSFSKEQQAVAALQQTSKQLQAAVAQLLPGQLPVVLHARKLQQTTGFAQWLQKHGSLLQGLAVVWVGGNVYGHSRCFWRPAAAAAVAGALQAAAAAGCLQLQSFTLPGSVAPPGLLLHLPAEHITQLHVKIDVLNRGSMTAMQRLTNLRSLTLHKDSATNADAEDLGEIPQSLAATLQQLTLLRVGVIRPAQLCCITSKLPPQLQQLHAEVSVHQNAQELVLLVRWLKQHRRIITSLKVCDADCCGRGWASAWTALAAAFGAASDAAVPTPAASTAARGSNRLQLQSFSAAVGDHGTAAALAQLLQHLPAHSLTQLGCCLSCSDAGEMRPPAVNGLSRLTALRRLCLFISVREASLQPHTLLAPLSALPQLTAVQLLRSSGRGWQVSRGQLQHLQLPRLKQLKQLEASVGGALTERVNQLQLAHLTAVTQLSLELTAYVLAPSEQLPPNVRVLSLNYFSEDEYVSHSGQYSLQPLLPLTRLQRLQLWMSNGAPAAHELAALSSISSLTSVDLCFNWGVGADHINGEQAAAAAAAEGVAAPWPTLPLRALSWGSSRILPAVLQAITALHGLTCLALHTTSWRAGDGLAPAQAAAALQQLTGLRQLELTCSYDAGLSNIGGTSDGEDPDVGAEAVEALLSALGGLRELGYMCVRLQIGISGSNCGHIPALSCHSINSTSISSSSTMQPADDVLTTSNHSLYEPQLLTPILRHRSISQDQQAIAALLQTSKHLQAAVVQLLPGQLPVLLHTSQLQQVLLLAQWLRKHAGLVKSLAVYYESSGAEIQEYPAPTYTAGAVLCNALAAAATAAAPGVLQLQSFSINLQTWPELQQSLPVAHLTKLTAGTLISNTDYMKAIFGLTNLRELRLTSFDRVPAADETLLRLAAGLQQLTLLQIGPVTPAQLQLLPRKLQQLHAAVQLCFDSAADIAALCRPELTALRSLQINAPGNSGPSWQQDAVLAPMSALQQLTRLKLDIVRRVQLKHLQLPQLQELECWCSHTDEGEMLHMSQLTSLRKLTLTSYTAALRRDDQLPPNLQELLYLLITQRGDVYEGGKLQPLLALSRLQQLQLEFAGAPAVPAAELQQLSSLGRLQELRLAYRGCREADAVGDAAAWLLLPLTSFEWGSDELPAAVLQQLGKLKGLTQLVLHASGVSGSSCSIESTPRQLAAVLQQLTKLRCLTIDGYDSMAVDGAAADTAAAGGGGGGDVDGDWHSVDGVRAFLQAVGRLSTLQQATVVLPVRLQESAVQQLRGLLQQLLPKWLARCCEVQQDSVAVRLRTVAGRRLHWAAPARPVAICSSGHVDSD
uniref:Uncharacterized protein n=1 Tax=Tetradesmus obliquus TaxID=3088 RepID=A0A383W3M9_TETOB|eukprot:jgi/Sobl393_1/10205/SZX71722.1